jgi:hypothetical protein
MSATEARRRSVALTPEAARRPGLVDRMGLLFPSVLNDDQLRNARSVRQGSPANVESPTCPGTARALLSSGGANA